MLNNLSKLKTQTSMNYVYGLILLITTQLLAQSNAFASEKGTILVFGDSLSAAYNMEAEQGWPKLLAKYLDEHKLPYKVSNASISGETTTGGLARLEAQLNRSKADIVILELGANDGLRGFNLDVPRKNLNSMITMSLKHGAQVVLAGIHIPPNYGRSYTRGFDQIYTDLAKQYDLVLIPFLLEGVATNPELMQKDRLHPKPAGQKIIVKTVLEYLLPLL